MPSSPDKALAIVSSPQKKSGASALRLGGYTETVSSGALTSKKVHAKVTLNNIGVDTPTDDQLRELFTMFDADQNGFIDRAEFVNFMTNHFENFGAPMTSSDIDRLFSKLDGGDPKKKGQSAAGDGKLSLEEFSVLILAKLAA